MSADASSVALLALTTQHGIEWAVEADRVRRIATEADYEGAAAAELGAILLPWSSEPEPVRAGAREAVPADGEGRRIVVLDSARGPIAIAVVGVMTLRSVAAHEILTLPEFVVRSARARLLAGVVITERRPEHAAGEAVSSPPLRVIGLMDPDRVADWITRAHTSVGARAE